MTSKKQDAGLSAEFTVTLSDLFLAPENPRYNEPADANIPALAATMDLRTTAGQLVALFVRKARRGETGYGVLDGRRRLYAFNHLASEGLIDPAAQQVRVIECLTPEAIAAACVVANDQRESVNDGQIIMSIKQMRKNRITMDKIAAALSLSAQDARRFAKMAEADDTLIGLLASDEIDLSMFKLIARLPAESQASMAASIKDGRDIQEWEVEEILDNGGIEATDALARFIGEDAYVAAGGSVIRDLMEERPDHWTNNSAIADAYKTHLQPIIEHFKGKGLTVFVGTAPERNAPKGFADLGYYHWQHTDAVKKANKDLISEISELVPSWNSDMDTAELVTQSVAWLDKAYDYACKKFEGMGVSAVVIAPEHGRPITAEFYTTDDAYKAWAEALRKEREASYTTPYRTEPRDNIPTRNVVVDVAVSGNPFHEKATRIATRALQVGVSRDISAVLRIITASMVRDVLVNTGAGEDRLLQATFGVRVLGDYQTEDGIDADLVTDLQAYRGRFLASEMTTLSWVNSLEFSEVQDMLAKMTAVNLVVNEKKKDWLKPRARSEAQELAEMILLDVRDIVIPGKELYSLCSKKQLLGYLEQMGLNPDDAAKMKKGELIELVADTAAERRWAPPAVDFADDATAPSKEPVELEDEANLSSSDVGTTQDASHDAEQTLEDYEADLEEAHA